MGNCKFCGKPAGFLHTEHTECEQLHENSRKQIVAEISQALSPSGSLDAFQSRLTEIAQDGHISEYERHTLLVQGWTAAVDRYLEDGVLDESEETRLVEFKNRFSLAEADLDAGGALTKIVKAAVIRDVLNGVIPRRMEVERNLPICTTVLEGLKVGRLTEPNVCTSTPGWL